MCFKGDDSRAGRKKKKKCNKRKRQKLDMVSSEDLSGDDDDDGLGDGEEGGDGPADPGMLPESQSRAGGRRTGETTEVETVTFRDPFKKKNKTESKDSEIKLPQTNEKGEKAPKSFGLETARLEVHRFGIAGFQKQQQRLFERERAIMLGARVGIGVSAFSPSPGVNLCNEVCAERHPLAFPLQPPKREYVNYKVYQQTLKEKKQEKKEMKSVSFPISLVGKYSCSSPSHHGKAKFFVVF
uniref:Uncharacterized protein n=1 Tax=Scleropages formosus TaxID=113540 RepID=A0A8C9STX5_SCLFO